MRVSGGPEALLTIAEEGVLTDDRPVLLGSDPGTATESVLTDTMRRRDMSIGDIRRSRTATLAEDEPFESVGPVEDLVDPAWAQPKTVAWLSGVASVRASSSESSLDALSRDPGRQPYSAVDGDVRTGWRSTGWTPPTEQWLEVEFTEPTAVAPLRAVFEDSTQAAQVTEVVVRTDAGTARTRLNAAGGWQALNVRSGRTRTLRISIDKVAPGANGRVGISEVAIPGVTPSRTLVVPDLAGAEDPVIVTSRTDAISSCMRGSYAWTCGEALGALGDDGYGFDRSFPVETAGEKVLSGRVTIVDQALAGRMLAFPGVWPRVAASSTLGEVPATGAYAAFDDDRRTIWYASDRDLAPWLTAELGKTVQLSRIRVDFPDTRLGAPPVRVTIETDGGTRRGWAGPDGWITFAPMKASRIKLTFSAAGTRPVEVLGVGIPGVEPLPSYEDVPLTVPCGLGPVLEVDGSAVRTEIVSGTVGDLLAGRPLDYRTCRPVTIEAGTARVRARPGTGFRFDSLVVRAEEDAEEDGKGDAGERAGRTFMRPAEVLAWGPGERRLRVSAGEASYLVVNENHNRGWVATVNGRELAPARLDGWRQAWRLPAGTEGTVTIVYAPNGLYRASLVLGFALVALVLALCLIRDRPRAPLAAAPPAAVRAAWLWPAAPALGYWVGGWGGAVVLGAVAALALWARGVAAAEHGRGRPYAVARALASPWPVLAGMGVAGVALAAGGPVGYDGTPGQILSRVASLAVLGLLFAAIGTVRPAPPPRYRAAEPRDTAAEEERPRAEVP
ncbi:alpha-(1-_3)-arabinofuranosyltransferase domain-containing protein [Thermocatellispora tengchongensis]|uniref:alpha-(1->3)-arabinofuranosyltransferase domain-containing protein n=1 Tax=Thermocatellispora tengchongensis TaxID=1073253 RepID=UPI0036319AB5